MMDVWEVVLNAPRRREGVDRRADHFDIGRRIQDLGQRLPCGGRVVDDQHSDDLLHSVLDVTMRLGRWTAARA